MVRWKFFKKKVYKNSLDRIYLLDIQLLKALFDKGGYFKFNDILFNKWQKYIEFLEKGNEKMESQ